MSTGRSETVDTTHESSEAIGARFARRLKGLLGPGNSEAETIGLPVPNSPSLKVRDEEDLEVNAWTRLEHDEVEEIRRGMGSRTLEPETANAYLNTRVVNTVDILERQRMDAEIAEKIGQASGLSHLIDCLQRREPWTLPVDQPARIAAAFAPKETSEDVVVPEGDYVDTDRMNASHARSARLLYSGLAALFGNLCIGEKTAYQRFDVHGKYHEGEKRALLDAVETIEALGGDILSAHAEFGSFSCQINALELKVTAPESAESIVGLQA